VRPHTLNTALRNPRSTGWCSISTEHQTPNSKHQTPNTKSRTPNATGGQGGASFPPNTKHQTPNSKHQTPNTKSRTPDAPPGSQGGTIGSSQWAVKHLTGPPNTKHQTQHPVDRVVQHFQAHRPLYHQTPNPKRTRWTGWCSVSTEHQTPNSKHQTPNTKSRTPNAPGRQGGAAFPGQGPHTKYQTPNPEPQTHHQVVRVVPVNLKP